MLLCPVLRVYSCEQRSQQAQSTGAAAQQIKRTSPPSRPSVPQPLRGEESGGGRAGTRDSSASPLRSSLCPLTDPSWSYFPGEDGNEVFFRIKEINPTEEADECLPV
ncbi:hypothetical protein GUJ93_ZPchr0670g33277 [Zizania palustris]|uniref:Uncharacterized protein n=1 Tax=Zizania palustris TaxID=103762 RepID=A0A8J5RCM8_ZIZPA|nr:hypothetical protein GUJ93_ZPchr0670g33277 [Zizania palustris]